MLLSPLRLKSASDCDRLSGCFELVYDSRYGIKLRDKDTESSPHKYSFLDFEDDGGVLKLKMQIYSGSIRMLVKAERYEKEHMYLHSH